MTLTQGKQAEDLMLLLECNYIPSDCLQSHSSGNAWQSARAQRPMHGKAIASPARSCKRVGAWDRFNCPVANLTKANNSGGTSVLF